MNQNDTIWTAACRQLKEVLSSDIYDRWIAVIQCREISSDELRLVVANDFYKAWLEENYLPMIRKAVLVASGRETNVTLSVDPGFFASQAEEEPAVASPAPSGGRRKKPNHNLNANYVFDAFVVGSSNEFAHAAALAVANTPSRAYNPLFIYGGVGFGKTHLMQAIGNHVVAARPRTKVCYTTCETFVNEYIEALQEKSVSTFRRKYRGIDVLLIDDVQFLGKKQGLQEEFFHTFNALFQNHKQIVMTSDRTPAELDGLAPRLISRFEWGLVTELDKPNLEIRTAILRKKAEQMKLDVDDALVDYLAERITSNIRTLEGALIRVASYASLIGRSLDADRLDELLKDVFDKEAKAVVSVDVIQRTVAEHFDLRHADILGKRRTKEIAHPRQIAMHLARAMTTQSFPTLGEAFNRNHATILYAHEQIRKKAEEDRSLRQTLSFLQEKVRKNAISAAVR